MKEQKLNLIYSLKLGAHAIVRADLYGRGQTVLNLTRFYQYSMQVDRLHYNLNVHI